MVVVQWGYGLAIPQTFGNITETSLLVQYRNYNFVLCECVFQFALEPFWLERRLGNNGQNGFGLLENSLDFRLPFLTGLQFPLVEPYRNAIPPEARSEGSGDGSAFRFRGRTK